MAHFMCHVPFECVLGVALRVMFTMNFVGMLCPCRCVALDKHMAQQARYIFAQHILSLVLMPIEQRLFM